MISPRNVMLTGTLTQRSPKVSVIDRGLRHLFYRKLAAFTDGEIAVVDGGKSRVFGSAATSGLRSRIDIRDPRTYRAVALGGTIGAAEAYAQRWWDADDLTALVRIMARNRDAANGLEGWSTWLRRATHLAAFRLRRNRKTQSRKNISAHYDLGNDFFASFLDPTMTYSCAVFPHLESDLEDGSRHKLDLICRKLELSSHDSLLEIGSGWGSLALHAAHHYGCRVVTTTISREQFDHVTTLVRAKGVADRVTVLQVDYRDLPTRLERRFDKVVSVEMIEAVGDAYLDRYFGVCEAMTKPGGAMLLQSIVIADAFFETYRRSVDVIQRYVFPGGFLPSRHDLERRIARSTTFRVADLDDITGHYPKTLRLWRDGLRDNWSRLRAAGYPQSLLRMWEYYFCYSEGGFLEQTIGDVQLLLVKPQT